MSKPTVIVKMMPDSLNGKSYDKAERKQEWIVIHNTSSGQAIGNVNYFHGGADGRNTCTQYVIDDKEIYKILEDTWKAQHAGVPKENMYAKGKCTNHNSIGIEIADGNKVDHLVAIENGIELARYLAKKHNIHTDNIIQHYDVSGKDCPATIRKLNKWDYFKSECKKRNDEQREIDFDTSLLGMIDLGGNGSTPPTSDTSGTDILPEFDNREDWTNLKDVKGVVLSYHPVTNLVSVKNKEEYFEKNNITKTYHYVGDSAVFNDEVQTNLIAFSMEDNDTHTYIDRALFKNKSPKETLSVGIFTSSMLEDYTITEKNIIKNTAKVLYENGLETNDLWREFDLNRAPSPLIYLDREKWKKFLMEIDTQIEWRYENFGEPNISKKNEQNIGKEATVILEQATVYSEPNLTSSNYGVLKLNDKVLIEDYKNRFYKIKILHEEAEVFAWIRERAVSCEETSSDNINGQENIGKSFAISAEKANLYQEANDVSTIIGSVIKGATGKIDEYLNSFYKITLASVTGTGWIKHSDIKINEENRLLPRTFIPTTKYISRNTSNIGKTLKINENDTSMYKEAKADSEEIGSLSKNKEYEVLDYTDMFYKITVPASEEDKENGIEDLTGWVLEDDVYIIIDKGIPQPDTKVVTTHEEYLKLMEYKDPKLIDLYTASHEPYDKGLEEILYAVITDDDRLSSLSKTIKTKNENDIHYAVIEATPGSTGHCAVASNELNILYKPEDCKVEPIYPDLIVPPSYSSTEYSMSDNRKLPITQLNNNSIKDASDFDGQVEFDYDILKDKKKESSGSPINYSDPYPYDDKIIELEKHYPKVKIDEFAARMYECNHPGCPIAQPMAKNFAAIVDAELSQSKRIEKRLVKLENTLAYTLRLLGRLGSRINVNCVYYGGTDTFGKYKSVRCLDDDRVKEGGSVTIDQCASCTRFEPIIGQIYDILDESGLNGSVLLDDMQMSYMDIDDFKNLNTIQNRSTKYKYSKTDEVSEEDYVSNEDRYKERDKKIYEDKLKKEITDETKLKEALDKVNEEDYLFRMDWTEQDLNTQEPDVKPYPIEKIKAKYKTVSGDPGEVPTNNSLDDILDKDTIDDMDKYEDMSNSIWTDTREEADTFQENKYSSEDFFFEGFNINQGMQQGAGGNPGASFGAECRNKICEKAREIVSLHVDEKKAGYSQSPRTIDDTDRKVGSNKHMTNVFVYDCSSFTSCCYKHAGLNSLYNKNTDAGVKEVVNNKGLMWLANEEGIKKALPGDVIYRATNGNVSEAMMNTEIDVEHVMVYLGDGKVAHSSSDRYEHPKQIRIDDFTAKANHFFARPKDLIDADEAAGSSGANGGHAITSVTNLKGEALTAVWAFPQAVLTGYDDLGSYASWSGGATSANRALRKYCAAKNIPFGTKIYIPWAEEKKWGDNGSGIFEVVDTGGPFFDFDLHVPDYNTVGKCNEDCYVLSWGTKPPSWSFTDAMNFYNDAKWSKYTSAWNEYKRMNGVVMNFWMFKDADKSIKQHPRY